MSWVLYVFTLVGIHNSSNAAHTYKFNLLLQVQQHTSNGLKICWVNDLVVFHERMCEHKMRCIDAT
jgi:hypothetical protein